MRYSPLAILVAASLASSLALAQTAPSQKNTIRFEGEVTAQTCQATIDGANDTVILLPTVSKSELQSADSTVGRTVFTLNVTDCNPDNNKDTTITVKFNGRSVTKGGNLDNSASGSSAAKNVAVQLLSPKNSEKIVLGTKTAGKASGLILEKGKNSATYDFAAQYISEEGGATAGSVQAVVEYTLGYQ